MLFAALAAHDVDVRDVEQVVIRERLMLGCCWTRRTDPAALREAVRQAMASVGMQVRPHRRADDPAARRQPRTSS